MTTLISVSLALSLHCQTTDRGAPVYVPAYAGTPCAYPRRDGQAELTWMAGYLSRECTRLTHPRTNKYRYKY